MKPRSMFLQVTHAVGLDIVNGRWTPGQVVNPDVLETEQGVSRSVIREAVRTLQDKGLLVARPNYGTRVRPITDWDLLDPDVALWIARSPNHPDLKIHAKEFVDALLMLTPAFGDNPYLTRALAALNPEMPAE